MTDSSGGEIDCVLLASAKFIPYFSIFTVSLHSAVFLLLTCFTSSVLVMRWNNSLQIVT